MQLPRSSGIVLHLTSLPEGRLGRSAYAFVDWLEAAGQSWWQVLPLGPPDDVGSPYASASAFAAWSGFLADPGAPVSARELASFRKRTAYWAGAWEEAGGDLADQVRFQREWTALRDYARARGIRLIGDLPIYVAWGSVDHRSHPDLFLEGVVAGAPPDAMGPEGQHWGNPLFDWDALARDDYRWWIERLRRTFELVDLTRIDHFRGFAAFWAIPEGSIDAREGYWLPGPGLPLFRAAEQELGALPVLAEDLGLITADVEALREELGFPGMVVLLWAFSGPGDNPHRLRNHLERQVVYTTTHDTDTLRGHFPRRDHRRLIELALSSRAALCMIPAQDVLGLGSEGRMNRPGRRLGNWAWRLEPGRLTPELAAGLRETTEAAGRLP
ncbi:MAG: 4-alpha-glucanotransferase [Actinobacteria bacterium]|nr:4-alpha-glucanotransferase [Actinomycetota bacterium]